MAFEIREEIPEELTAAKRRSYSGLLQSKESARILEGRNPYNLSNFKLFLLGAYSDSEELVGCCAISIYPIVRTSDLHYIFVKEEFRHQGVAEQLLRYLEKFLLLKNVYVCWARYLQEDPYKPVFQHLFEKTGWGPPTLEKETYFFDVALFNPPWFSKRYPLPAGCTMFPWMELTDQERDKIFEMEKQVSFPREISPLRSKYAIEPINSLGIRYEDRVVGWLLTNRVKKDLIKYYSFYMAPDFRKTSCFWMLGIESMSRQKASNVQWACCTVNPSTVFSTWRRFAHTYLKPNAQRIEHLYVSTLDLSDKLQSDA